MFQRKVNALVNEFASAQVEGVRQLVYFLHLFRIDSNRSLFFFYDFGMKSDILAPPLLLYCIL